MNRYAGISFFSTSWERCSFSRKRIGIALVSAGSGISVDSVVADFISGAAEALSPPNDPDHWGIIEGQGALMHPSFAGVSRGTPPRSKVKIGSSRWRKSIHSAGAFPLARKSGEGSFSPVAVSPLWRSGFPRGRLTSFRQNNTPRRQKLDKRPADQGTPEPAQKSFCLFPVSSNDLPL